MIRSTETLTSKMYRIGPFDASTVIAVTDSNGENTYPDVAHEWCTIQEGFNDLPILVHGFHEC